MESVDRLGGGEKSSRTDRFQRLHRLNTGVLMMKKWLFNSALCALAVGVIAAPAHASSVPIGGNMSDSTENIGNFTGSVEYTYNTGDLSGNLAISLTNTTVGKDLKITGFVFNSDVDGLSVVLTPNPTGSFDSLAGSAANPFGDFEFGAALGANWEGGGSPNDGIHVGDSLTFNFTVTSGTVDLSALDTMDFLTESGHDAESVTYAGQVLVVRFRGDDSDKVPSDTGGTPAPGPGLPLPSAALSGLGLLGCFGLTRRRAR
jgi:hypothetical protein